MQARVGRSGWSDEETRALMDAAHRARAAGRPLREVFDAAAFRTGRKPNSIRNYYYACSRMEEGARRERFTPFGDDEAENLAEAILTARAAGQSVRACVMRLSGGDQRLMLRLQNKYRAMLKSRPDVIARVMARLRERGLNPPEPTGKARAPRVSYEKLHLAAGRDARTENMLCTLLEVIETAGRADALKHAALRAAQAMRKYVALPDDERADSVPALTCELDKIAAEIERIAAESGA